MSTPITLYGIPNCDTVKKSRTWFEAQGKPYRFHDFKKEGVSLPLLQSWVGKVGWQVLPNTKGTTWRKLSESDRATAVDADTAMALMLAHPSLIKRPVVSHADMLTVGFMPEKWQDCE